MTGDIEKHLLTADYRGREYKRAALNAMRNEIVELCAEIAEREHPSATREERTYGRFIASEIRRMKKP